MTSMPLQPPMPSRFGIWLLPAFGVAMVVMIVAFAWLQTERERRSAMSLALTASDNLARAFEEHVVATVKSIDQLLLNIARDYRRDPDNFNFGGWAESGDVILGASTTLLGVADRNGGVTANNVGRTGMSIADREHFMVHRDRADVGLFIGKPVVTRASGQSSILFTRRLDKPDGSFAGIVSLGLDPSHFANFYGSINIGGRGVVAVVGLDGVIRARLDADNRTVGQSIRQSILFTRVEQTPVGNYVARYVTDGVERIVSYRRVTGYPLIVTLGQATDDVLAGYRGFRRTLLLSATVLSMVVLFVTWLLVREVARRRAGERLFQTVLEAIPVTIQVKDEQLRIQWVNRAFRDFFRHSIADPIGKTIATSEIDAPTVATIQSHDREVLRSGRTMSNLEQRYPAVNGEPEIHLLVTKVPIFDAEGKAVQVLTIGTNITALEQAKAELQRLNEELERRVAERTAELARSMELVATVFRSAPVPIVLYGRDGRIADWNPAAERFTGYAAAEVIGTRVWHQDRQAQAQLAKMEAKVRGGESFLGLEARRRAKDGREIEFLVSGAPLMGAGGTVEGAVGIWLDVTQQRAMERQLRQAQKMEAVGQLTGGVAHDFNNLLGVIVGNLDLLAEKFSPQSSERALAIGAIEAAERGASLTRRLLAFSRQQTLISRPTDVGELAHSLVGMLRRTLGESIKIRVEAPDRPIHCMVDPAQLEAALLNLALNARDAMPLGGALTLEIAQTCIGADRDGDLAELAPGDYAEISVSDTGEGMTPEVLSRCFDPFYTTKEVGKGSGLGLSMIFGFVSQSNGLVKAYSEVGHGTTFKIFLPLAPAAVGEEPETRESPTMAGEGELVLVVEDNEALREVSATAVRSLGYRVIEAADAAEALAALMANPEIKLLFADVMMPGGTNGIQLAEQATRTWPGLKVLLTSGYTGAALADKGALATTYALIGKPFRRTELGRRIAQLLGRPEINSAA